MGDEPTERPKLTLQRNDGPIVTLLERTDRRRGMPRACSHSQVAVHETERLVECDTCGASLDPWQVLLEFANDSRAFACTRDAVARLKAEGTTLAQRVDRLKDQINRLRGQIRRAGEEPVVHTSSPDCMCWQCTPITIPMSLEAHEVLRPLSEQERGALVSRLVMDWHKGS